jgi:hypothetical protein
MFSKQYVDEFMIRRNFPNSRIQRKEKMKQGVKGGGSTP